MPLTTDLIDKAVERYWREIDRYAKLSEFVGEACRKLLEENVIRGSVQWRAKNPDRLRAKLQKHLANGEHAEEYTDLDSIFRVLRDLAGARITTYVETDREKVITLLQKRFLGEGEKQEVIGNKKDDPEYFYRATHCLVRLKNEDLIGRYANLKDLGCEIQVCSLLAHVFNEIEHDLRYKPLSGALSIKEEELLDALGHLTATGDTIINQTLNAVEDRQKENTEGFEDEYDFVARMRPLFPAENFASNAGQLYEVCVKLGLDSPGKIRTALKWDDTTTAQEGVTLAQRLSDAVNPNPDIQLEIDPQSSDQLLMLILSDENRVSQLKKLYPSGWGVGRAPRFLSVAKQLQSLLNVA